MDGEVPAAVQTVAAAVADEGWMLRGIGLPGCVFCAVVICQEALNVPHLASLSRQVIAR